MISEELDSLADQCAIDIFAEPLNGRTAKEFIRSAFNEAIERVLKQEPSLDVLNACNDRMWEGASRLRAGSVDRALWAEVFKAMASALLEEVKR